MLGVWRYRGQSRTVDELLQQAPPAVGAPVASTSPAAAELVQQAPLAGEAPVASTFAATARGACCPAHLQPAECAAMGSSTARGACCTRPAAVRTAGDGAWWGNRLVLGAGAVQEMR